jgi:hypothetical protein
MKPIPHILHLLLALMLSAAAQAQTRFATTQLRHTARQLGLDRLDTLRDGVTTLRYKNQPLRIRKQEGRIESIGRTIFSPQLRRDNPLPIYDYLEFAYLDKLWKVSDNPLLYTDLRFTRGSWADMAAVGEQTTCNISMTEDKHYSVTWLDGSGKTICALTFPVDYERLAMTSRRELEANFINDLRTHRRTKPAAYTPTPDPAKMQTDDGKLYTMPGGTYLMNAINADTYYVSDRRQQLQLLWYVKNPARSVRNLFCVSSPLFEETTIALRFTMYDMTIQEVTVALPDFLDYCRQKGCEVYVGIESFDDTEVKASVFMYDRNSGYDHIFTCTIPARQVGAARCRVTARASLYAPTTNVTTLFYEFDQAKSKNRKP